MPVPVAFWTYLVDQADRADLHPPLWQRLTERADDRPGRLAGGAVGDGDVRGQRQLVSGPARVAGDFAGRVPGSFENWDERLGGPGGEHDRFRVVEDLPERDGDRRDVC